MDVLNAYVPDGNMEVAPPRVLLLRRYLRRFSYEKRRLTLGIAASLSRLGFLVPIPLLLREVIDEIASLRDGGALVKPVVAVVGLYLLNSGAHALSSNLVVGSLGRVVGSLRKDLLDKLYSCPTTIRGRPNAAVSTRYLFTTPVV